MIKKMFLSTVVMGIALVSFSQKEVKYVKMFYKNASVETNELTILIDNAVSTEAETKFKLKITNKTADFVLFKPQECKFIINGKESKPTEKQKIIEPNSSDFLTVNLKGAGYNAVKNYSFEVGGLYLISSAGQAAVAPEFKLPPSKNEIRFGGFSVVMDKLYKSTDQTDVKFKCTYSGDKAALIYPKRLGVKMPDGNEYANEKGDGLLGKKGAILITKGQTESFIATWDRFEGGKAMDMQLVEMFINWNDMFTESVPFLLKSERLEMEFDEALSNEKGR